MVETPARLATSRMRAPLPLILFFGVVVCSAGFAGAVPILRIVSNVIKRFSGVKHGSGVWAIFLLVPVSDVLVVAQSALTATKLRDSPRCSGRMAVVCEEIGPVDDPTLNYIVCGKPLLVRLQQILTQTAGFALLVMT